MLHPCRVQGFVWESPAEEGFSFVPVIALHCSLLTPAGGFSRTLLAFPSPLCLEYKQSLCFLVKSYTDWFYWICEAFMRWFYKSRRRGFHKSRKSKLGTPLTCHYLSQELCWLLPMALAIPWVVTICDLFFLRSEAFPFLNLYLLPFLNLNSPMNPNPKEKFISLAR